MMANPGAGETGGPAGRASGRDMDSLFSIWGAGAVCIATAVACGPQLDDDYEGDGDRERRGIALLASGSESGGGESGGGESGASESGASGETSSGSGAAEPIDCTEHHECPTAACHLAGPMAGTCFDPADVVDVPNAGGAPALWAQVQGLAEGSSLAVRLAPGNYSMLGLEIPPGVEVAIVGYPWAYLWGSELIEMIEGTDVILYLDELVLVGQNSDGVHLVDSQLWVDDTSLGNFGASPFRVVFPPSQLHLRRVESHGNFVGIAAASGASAFIQDSVITNDYHPIALTGPTLIETSAFFSGVSNPMWLTGEFDISYSTIVGSPLFGPAGGGPMVNCSGATGNIRSSIVGSTTGTALNPDCDGISIDFSVVDQAPAVGKGSVALGPMDLGWFVDPVGDDLHLHPTQTAIIPIADRGPFDPEFDIDGEPIPIGESWPGFDQAD